MLPKLVADQAGMCGVSRQEMSARASTNTGSSELACTQFVSRDFEQIYFEMVYEEFEVIQGLTGCKKPCRYLEYKLLPGGGIPTSFQSKHFVFSLLAQSRLNFSYQQVQINLLPGTPWLRRRSCCTPPPRWSLKLAALLVFFSASPS